MVGEPHRSLMCEPLMETKIESVEKLELIHFLQKRLLKARFTKAAKVLELLFWLPIAIHI